MTRLGVDVLDFAIGKLRGFRCQTVMYDQALPLAVIVSALWLSHAHLQHAKSVRNYQVH